MAILSISRIQHRRGKQEDLPQLASGELGWSIDQRRLYIGNGTTNEGAPTAGNTELLTQYSDIFSISGSYLFKGEQGGYTVVTGPGNLSPAERRLQDKLDDIVNARDFGVTGDGVTNDVDAINRAIEQLHRAAVLLGDPRVRRTLMLPAGTYKLDGDYIRLLPYVKLRGEGKYATIINQTDITQPCAIMTTDSKGQIGTAINTNAAIAPGQNEIVAMSIKVSGDINVLVIDSATKLYCSRVAFGGARIQFVSGQQTNSCVVVQATVTTVDQVYLEYCDFSDHSIAILLSDRAENVVVLGCDFNNLCQGIVIGRYTTTPTQIKNIRVCYSSFNNTAQQGIVGYDLVEGIVSTGNSFKNVGNNMSATPFTSVVEFKGANCYSIADTFARADGAVVPAVNLNGQASFATLPSGRLMVGKTLTTGSRDVLLENGQVTVIDAGIVGLAGHNATYGYSIERHGMVGTPIVRTGLITVAAVGASLVYSDDYVETDDAGVTLVPRVINGLITLTYTSTKSPLQPTITLKSNNTTLQ